MYKTEKIIYGTGLILFLCSCSSMQNSAQVPDTSTPKEQPKLVSKIFEENAATLASIAEQTANDIELGRFSFKMVKKSGPVSYSGDAALGMSIRQKANKLEEKVKQLDNATSTIDENSAKGKTPACEDKTSPARPEEDKTVVQMVQDNWKTLSVAIFAIYASICSTIGALKNGKNNSNRNSPSSQADGESNDTSLGGDDRIASGCEISSQEKPEGALKNDEVDPK